MSQDTIAIDLQDRTVTGKQVRALRREGVVPAVIHNHGKDSIIVQADGMLLRKTYQQAGKNHPVQISAGGKKYTAMIKSVAVEPRKGQLTHVVFNAVNANQQVDAEVPIHPKYDEGNEASPAERNGLLVLTNLDVVTVKALPANLPEALYYDAEKLVEVGDSLTTADLVIPKNVEFDAGEEPQAIATVYEPSAIAAANDAAGGDAEPEDAATVDSEHESGVIENDQDEELRPGGKKEAEDHEQGTNPTKQ